ncbi:MAG: hypothetical protein ACLSVD_10600 [Eggerthellaceae bacterium]
MPSARRKRQRHPGLFAVGEATHRFMYNRSFVRHCSNSSALTMGRLTGAALATA